MRSSLLLIPYVITALSFNIGFGQSNGWNLDFEQWQDAEYGNFIIDTIIENRVADIPYAWFCNSSRLSTCRGYSRTTDAAAGDYALVLSSFYQYQIMNISCGNESGAGWPIDFRPIALMGYNKNILLSPNVDSLHAYIDIYLTKYNLSQGLRDTVGSGHLTIKEVNLPYQEFSVSIDYNSELTPDSIELNLSKQRFGFPQAVECNECAHVFFDDLSLVAEETSTIELFEQKLNVYPNPAINRLLIKNVGFLKHLQIINSKGQLMNKLVTSNGKSELDVSKLLPGVYIIFDQNNHRTTKFLKL